MIWIAPSEQDTDNAALEKRLWDAGRICEVRSPSCEVQSIRHSTFVIRHLPRLSLHGVEKTDETGRLCRLNLAVHGLEGEIKHGGNINSYYDDPHAARSRKLGIDLANNSPCNGFARPWRPSIQVKEKPRQR